MNCFLTRLQAQRATLLTVFHFCCVYSIYADTLRHTDGTVIQGKIVHETPEQIKIENSYGTLVYQKEDLTKIERDAPAGSLNTSSKTAVYDFRQVIPAGPINPLRPPSVPPLVQYLPAPTTGTATASRTSTVGAGAAGSPKTASTATGSGTK